MDRITRGGGSSGPATVTQNVLPLPPGAYTPSNVRHNKQFESLTCDTEGTTIYTASEEPLVSDGPIPTVTAGGAIRILQYDLSAGAGAPALRGTFRYTLGPGEGNGLAELEALDPAGGSIPRGKRRLLSLERAWTAALGNTIRIFLVDLDGSAGQCTFAYCSYILLLFAHSTLSLTPWAGQSSPLA